MKRIISLVISIILFLSVSQLTSCTNDSATETSENTGVVSEITDEITESNQEIVIASGGEDIYTLIRYIDASKEEVTSIVEFKNSLNAKFKLSFAISADWTMPSAAPPADAPEIIIGLTCREHTLQVISQLNLGYGDCAIQICDDNKIVIVAPNYEDLHIGFDYFLNNVSTIKDDESGEEKIVYTGGNYLYECAQDHLWKDKEGEISFRIVYDKSGKNQKLAEDISKAMKKCFDITPEVICETEPEDNESYEIIVGLLSDRSRFDYDYSMLNALSYEIVTSDRSILLAATTDTSLKNAVDHFISQFIRTGNIVSLNLPVDHCFSYNTFFGGDSAALAEGADTRIMSFNILSEEWDAAAVLSGRDVRVSATILNYAPDVAALQEVSEAWYPILENYIGDKYSFTRKTTTTKSKTYTTLIYNTETTELINEGIHIYSVGNSARLRSVVWGLFRSKLTNAQYIVFSTHWDVGSEKTSQRLIQAQEMAQLAKDLSAQYGGVSVFACGDYNAAESTAEYKRFLSDSGFVDAKTNAQNINRACKTYHTLFQNANTSTYESIDHITFDEKISDKVIFYNTLIQDYVIDASDHCPIYIDIKTN